MPCTLSRTLQVKELMELGGFAEVRWRTELYFRGRLVWSSSDIPVWPSNRLQRSRAINFWSIRSGSGSSSAEPGKEDLLDILPDSQ